MDDEEDSEAKTRRQARRQSGPSPAKRKGAPSVSPKPRLEPLGENETVQDRASSPIARPQAPTPKKASGKAYDESPVPTRPSSKLAPPRAPPAGPRPPLSPRGSSYNSSDSGCVPTTPAIVLQEATPTKEIPPSTISSRPVSIIDPSSSGAAGPPLNVPQVHDVQLQHFFNEVANQLNTMNIRSSVASGSSGNSAILGSDYQAYLAYASNQAGPPVSPLIVNSELDPNQFADADDDETIELASIHSSFAPSVMGGQHSPLIGLGLGGPPPSSHGGRPGLYPLQTGGNAQRWSYASSHDSSYLGVTPASAVSESPGLYSPNPGWSAQPETQTLQAQRVAPLPPPLTAPRVSPPRPLSSLPGPMAESLLQREGSYVVIGDSDVLASDPSLNSWGSKQSGFSAHRGQDGFGMLKKKKKGTSIYRWSLALG